MLNDTLALPFFNDGHRRFADELSRWAAAKLHSLPHDDVDAACRARVKALGEAGFLKAAVPSSHGGLHPVLDVRTLCIAREILGFHDGLADFSFAMQGLGTGSISLYGSEDLKRKYLPPVRDGKAIAAFALSEPEAGSDVAALATTAKADGANFRLDGEKTWISNGGIADHYVVFARTGEAPGARGLSAFVIDAATPGLKVAERIEVIAPHPLARLKFTDCRIPKSRLLGVAGEGFKIAMRNLDVFRTSVAAAALGFARRALDEALKRATTRGMFRQTLADFQLTQAKLAQMATAVDASALLTYRASWLRDQGKTVTREAAMAKLTATEEAQRVIDGAVQLWGGLGLVRGQPVESLYREIRALRIYEGASEVQQLIVARELLREAKVSQAAASAR